MPNLAQEKKIYTIFDTETSGFKANGLCQLAAVLVNDEFEIQGAFNVLCIPEGFDEIEEGAFKVTGHTMENCHAHGIPLRAAIGMLLRFINLSTYTICHNTGYDIDRVMKAVEQTLGCTDRLIDPSRAFCTMKASTGVCKLPGRYGKYKWPNLQELHTHLFGEGFDGAHDAMADVMATLKCLRELHRTHPDIFPRDF